MIGERHVRGLAILIAIAVMDLLSSDCCAQIAENLTVLYSVGGKAGEFYGDSISSVGDLNHDGINDFVVGATFGGRATALSGKDGSVIFEMRATGSGTEFGEEVAGIGDVNGDGVPDILVGAPAANGKGAAFVYSGASGALLRTFNGLAAGDRFGEEIAGIGDLDGDGVGDLLIGSQNESRAGAAGAGTVYIFSGRTGVQIAALHGDAANDRFGTSVAGLPDLDGDSIPEIAIGAFGAGPSRTGRLYVYSGRTRERILTVDGESTGSTFGRYYVGVFGDVDGDGKPDLVTADISYSRGANTGRAYVISSATGDFVRTYTGTSGGQYLGTGTKQIADIDGDQVPDLFVGAAFDSTGGELAGKAYIYSGRTGVLLQTITGTRAGATLGARAVDVGDLNGDGLHELLLTAPTDGTNGQNAGRVYVISGASFKRTAPALHFVPPDGVAVVQRGQIELVLDNFTLACGSGPGSVPQLRIDVDDHLDHRTCVNQVVLQQSYPLGPHKLTVTLENAQGAALASTTLTISLVSNNRRRGVRS